MLFTPIRYINNGEPLDQVTLNRKGRDIQQNLEEVITRLTTTEGAINGSVTEQPDTLALRDQFGSSQFSEPREGTNPIRLNDASVSATGDRVVMRNAQGTAQFSQPTDGQHPVRAQDILSSCTIFAANPGNDWIVCDGRAVSRTTYAPLFNVIGTTYGNGNGSTTFNVPDLRPLLEVLTGMTGGGAFGSWDYSPPASGTASSDGIYMLGSSFNGSISASVNGITVVRTSARDKYGQGYVSGAFAMREGDSFSTSAGGFRRFLQFDLSLPEPETIDLPVNYYIRGR